MPMVATKLVIHPDIGRIDRVLKNGEVRINVGYLDDRGYRYLSVNNQQRPVHQVIWEFVNGAIPNGYEIDHVNGNPSDNQLCNLRLVTHSQNMQNQHRVGKKNKTSGVKGVHWEASRNKWRTHITVNGKQTYLGRFDKLEDAMRAYAEGARQIHTHNPHAMGDHQ